VLFISHLVVIAWLAFAKGLKLVKADISNDYGSQETDGVNINNDAIIKLSSGGAIFTVIAGEKYTLSCMEQVFPPLQS